jgi:hypothetical protein
MWQPIETAPKDRLVLLYVPRNPPEGKLHNPMTIGWADGLYHDGTIYWLSVEKSIVWDDLGLRPIEIYPTHWMPMPEPPLQLSSE